MLTLLVEKGVLSKDDAEGVRQIATMSKREPELVLYEKQLVDEKIIAEAKAELYGIPVKFFGTDEWIPREILTLIAEESSRHYQMVAFAKDYGELSVGMLNPDDQRAQEALKFIAQKLGVTVRLYIITPTDLARQLSRYRTFEEELKAALEQIRRDYLKEKEQEVESRKIFRLEEASKGGLREEAPIIKIVALILKQAVAQRASDVHIEPEKERLKIRFRIDGVLQPVLYLPLSIHGAVIARIKIMSNMKIDETRIPQDGRFRTIIDNREIDFRVSTFPTGAGEKVAIRVLDPTTGLKGLGELGFHDWNLRILNWAIEKPYGMILVTGPTGCGKTTTLYAILQQLNTDDVNIVTLEDPIEYYIFGINQSQVIPEIGYSFATGLRHILRQDPDIIMVGEMRDSETAELGVHAALTGHLVLSTLHTNNAIGVVPRLVDMGVAPYLLPSTLNIMIAQRLVRRLCPDCKKPAEAQGESEKVIEKALEELPKELRDSLPYKKPYIVYTPSGCGTCNQKGVLGRIGVHEILKMTPELEEIILTKISETALAAEAKRQGMLSMRQEGVLHALAGTVSLEEVIQETT